MKHLVESDLKPATWAAWGQLHDVMVSPSSEGERSSIPFEVSENPSSSARPQGVSRLVF